MVERGQIRNKELASRNNRDYSKLRFQNITPTDIDCFVELWNRGYWIMELKSEGANLRGGQRLAIERLTDTLTDAGKIAVAVVAIAPKGIENDILAHDCPVGEYRYLKAWEPGKDGLIVIDMWNWWIAKIQESLQAG